MARFLVACLFPVGLEGRFLQAHSVYDAAGPYASASLMDAHNESRSEAPKKKNWRVTLVKSLLSENKKALANQQNNKLKMLNSKPSDVSYICVIVKHDPKLLFPDGNGKNVKRTGDDAIIRKFLVSQSSLVSKFRTGSLQNSAEIRGALEKSIGRPWSEKDAMFFFVINGKTGNRGPVMMTYSDRKSMQDLMELYGTTEPVYPNDPEGEKVEYLEVMVSTSETYG